MSCILRGFWRVLSFAIVAMVVSHAQAQQQFENENLIIEGPKGYVLGYQTEDDKMNFMEFVPEGETVSNWSELLTVVIYKGRRDLTSEIYRTELHKGMSLVCSRADMTVMKNGMENGYPFSFWTEYCHLNFKSENRNSPF